MGRDSGAASIRTVGNLPVKPEQLPGRKAAGHCGQLLKPLQLNAFVFERTRSEFPIVTATKWSLFRNNLLRGRSTRSLISSSFHLEFVVSSSKQTEPINPYSRMTIAPPTHSRPTNYTKPTKIICSMASKSPEADLNSRLEKYEDVKYYERDNKKRYFDQEPGRRRRDRSRSRERKHRRRSRTPDSKDRRSDSRERYRERSADDSRDRRRDRRREGGRDRSRDGAGEKRKSRYADEKRPRREDRSPGDDYKGRRRDESRDGRLSRRRDVEEVENRPKQKQSPVRHKGPLPSQDDSFAVSKGEEPLKPVEKPNFGNTGALAAASNAVVQADGTTVALKYHEPPEARKPPARDVWKLFVFKDSEIVDTVELSLRSCWLVGRDMAVVDLPAEHPSISKQHAVIQFRYTEKRNEYGDKIGRVKPYLIDLESANGTSLNKKKVPDSRYLELRDKDMIQFGLSTREYVLMLAPKD